MNKQNPLTHLAEWCKKYGDDNGIKLFPTTAPLEIVVDELLERLSDMRKYNENLLNIYHGMNERMTNLEQVIAKESVKKVKK